MQIAAPYARVKDLIHKTSGIKMLKSLGTKLLEPRIFDPIHQNISILVFSYPARSVYNREICYISGVLVDEIYIGSLFHILSWSSHKAKRPVRSIRVAEVLGSGKAIYERKKVAQTASLVFEMDIPLYAALDSKDLFTSLSTQRNRIFKSIRAD